MSCGPSTDMGCGASAGGKDASAVPSAAEVPAEPPTKRLAAEAVAEPAVAPAEPAGTMMVGGGVTMLQCHYLAGFKEERWESYPTIPRLDINAEYTLDGTIDDLAKEHPELTPCLYNDVKICGKCGKPCAVTLIACNSCGASLEDIPLSKSENVFAAFLFGVRSAARGFPYKISMRRETEDVLVFDDMLQLTPCHLNGIPRRHYIPDWRFLLTDPERGLALLDLLEAELWEATQPFLQSEAFVQKLYRGECVSRDKIIAAFNFPPSQYQMHVQWLVPPLTPFQNYMALTKNHFHEGRGFPMSYVRKLLELREPYSVVRTTPVEEIMQHYKEKGIDYTTEWKRWYNEICLQTTLDSQNWQVEDFEYVVQRGEVFKISVEDSVVELGEKVPGADAKAIQARDKQAFQNYGRPYTAEQKPTGTYIQHPLQRTFGPEGLQPWPGVTVTDY